MGRCVRLRAGANAKAARSQLIGGIVFGIGMALLEETRVEAATGRIVNAVYHATGVQVHDLPIRIEDVLVG